jgi:hypothetical protein
MYKQRVRTEGGVWNRSSGRTYFELLLQHKKYGLERWEQGQPTGACITLVCMVLWNKDERGTNIYLPVFDLLIALQRHEVGQELCGGSFHYGT